MIRGLTALVRRWNLHLSSMSIDVKTPRSSCRTIALLQPLASAYAYVDLTGSLHIGLFNAVKEAATFNRPPCPKFYHVRA